MRFLSYEICCVDQLHRPRSVVIRSFYSNLPAIAVGHRTARVLDDAIE